MPPAPVSRVSGRCPRGWSLDLRPDVERGIRQAGSDYVSTTTGRRPGRPPGRRAGAAVVRRRAPPIPDVFIPTLGRIAEGALQATEGHAGTWPPRPPTVFLSWLIDGLPSGFEVTLSRRRGRRRRALRRGHVPVDRRGRRPLVSWLSWGLGLDQVWQTATASSRASGCCRRSSPSWPTTSCPTCPTTSSRTTRATSTKPSARSSTSFAGTTVGSLQDAPPSRRRATVVTPVVGRPRSLAAVLTWTGFDSSRPRRRQTGSPTVAPPTTTPDEAWNALWSAFTIPTVGPFAQAVDAMGTDFETLLDPTTRPPSIPAASPTSSAP